MIRARLERSSTGDDGTFGLLIFDKWWCYTLEPPWRDNAHNVSCIPTGTYQCDFSTMSRVVGGRRQLYRILGVPGRSGIFIHAGNWAGDRTKRLRSDSLGCPLLGLRRSVLLGQKAVSGSVDAVTGLIKYTAKLPFELEILEAK